MDKLQDWQDKFNECLGIELNEPQYFKVHHLLVLSYMLQSDSYTEEYRPEALRMLKAILEGTFVINRSAIQALNKKFSAGTRTVSISKPARIRDNIAWNKTILDIRLDSAENYQNDVFEWANSILQILSPSLLS